MLRRLPAAVALACALLPAASASAKAPALTVMTRNLYLGGDINRPLNATAGKSGMDALVAFGNANYTLRKIVDFTSFPTRSKLLAAEILERKPDLVGLQEVALWRSGPFSLSNVGKQTATTVDYDFLKTLLSDLKGRYSLVRKQRESDVEGPAFQGSDPSQATAARLTMYDAMLRRKAAPLKVLRSDSAQYKAHIDVSVSGVKFSFLRGYVWADVRFAGRKLRFITTHLESAQASVADRQAKEVLAGPVKAAGRKPVVLVCDCNSNPYDSKPFAEGDAPFNAPYKRLTAKLTDSWRTYAGSKRAYTWGFDELTQKPDPLKGFSERLDLVLTKPKMKVSKAWITGRDATTTAGLHASDHLGYVARLRP